MRLNNKATFSTMAFILLAITFTWLYSDNKESLAIDSHYSGKVTERDINLNARQDYDDLVEEGFQPRDDVPPWPFNTPVEWGADPFNDRNWQFQLHAWRGIDPILVKYYQTKDPALFHEALGFILDWKNFHQQNGAAKFSWYDMATGLRAMRIALILDDIYEGKVEVPESQVAALLKMANQHATRLQDEEFISLGNHGVFQVFGLSVLCSVIDDSPSCDNGQDFAQRMFEKIIDHAYTAEGVHKEHSPFYHHFTTVAINRYDASKFNSDRALSLVEKAIDVRPWLAWPDGHFVEAGDTEGETTPLRRQNSLQCLNDERCYAVGDYTESGYAIIRSNPGEDDQPSMIFVTGMAYSTTHKHADGLSFSLLENGEHVFIDSGKYGYERDKWWDYTRSAAAHNTISLSNHTISRDDISMDGSLLNSITNDESSFIISGQLERPGLFTQQREIEYTPGENLVIKDTVSSQSEQSFVSSLHLAPSLTPELNEKGFEVRLTNGELVSARLQDNDCEIDSIRGQEEPVLGWKSVGYLDMQPTTVVRAICSGTSRTITWNINFGQS
ncbi:heparinase II/III family protein [Halomonas stenophila]|uniref:Heparin-sulfate lyase N-terminal domain-containing protein n=1 Tax=Halomonas stenophila TaxID=795312 RepID=A0A7W5ER64_9GAMM|nr:heparinase II/III-family protein [Halomonas stenophila]MBB3229776.1 hypothetical protein [Halomonas stenophila]